MPAEISTSPVAEPALALGTATDLADALRLIRADGEPAAALALLDRRADELAKGPYSHEALLVRVDALLALHREDDLLGLLDRTNLSDVAAARALLYTRGHLRAAAHRCADAIDDFNRVLAEAGQAGRQALRERAACREQQGDHVGAQADRERYGREFSAYATAAGVGP
jgi:hypothetical protein